MPEDIKLLVYDRKIVHLPVFFCGSASTFSEVATSGFQ
jgi:hypothetical protein